MLKIRGMAGLLLLTLVIAVVAAACGQDDPTATPVPTATSTPVPGATATPTPEPTPTPSEADLFQIEWDQLISEAQAEGELVIILSAPASRNNREIFDSFGTKFGINVLQAGGSGTSNVNRVLAERANGVYDVDVSVVGASSTDRLRLAGALVPMRPLIIHPEVNDRSQGWLLTEWAWTDVENKYSPAYNLRLRENIVEIFYNTNEVSQAEIDSVLSWQDFLKPEWKGRIVAIMDPDFGGASTDRTLAWILLGPEWIEAFIRNQDVSFLPGGSFADMSTGIGRGKYHVAMFTGAASTDMEAMMDLGIPIAKLTRTLSEGGTVEVRGTLTVLERSPHPKAGQLFVNWFLSKEGQQTRHDLTADTDLSPSLRTDLEQGKVPDRQWEQLKVLDPASAISQSTPEWFKARDEVIDFTRAIYAELGLYAQ
ncbi:MAG: extracellular solute-binding protein [Chloroflexi bacterium]|nr:extracellular solute-binding protein [Chloroflexota bacterium]